MSNASIGTPNVISPKSLEKQLKIVESRMAVLLNEVTELEKIKNACLTLMGVTSEPVETANEAGKAKKKKSNAEEQSDSESTVEEYAAEDSEGASATH